MTTAELRNSPSPGSGMLRLENQLDERVMDRHRIEVDHEAAAAQQEQTGKRDDERLNLAEVDDQPLQRAKQQSEREHQGGGRERMPPGDIEIGDHDADEADHRADRQVDAAGQDDEGRADRRGDDEGVVGEDVAEHLRRQEIVVEHIRRSGTARRTRAIVARSGRYFSFIASSSRKRCTTRRGGWSIAGAAR